MKSKENKIHHILAYNIIRTLMKNHLLCVIESKRCRLYRSDFNKTHHLTEVEYGKRYRRSQIHTGSNR